MCDGVRARWTEGNGTVRVDIYGGVRARCTENGQKVGLGWE